MGMGLAISRTIANAHGGKIWSDGASGGGWERTSGGAVGSEPRASRMIHGPAIKNDPDRKLRDLADVRELARLPNVDREKIRRYFDSLGLEELYDEEIASGNQ